MSKKVLEYWGENYWGHRVYKQKGMDKYFADLGNEEHPDIHILSPFNDPDGEPNMHINPEKFIIEVKPEEPKKSIAELKFTLAKMIAANEYKEGKSAVEWVDLANGIHNLPLTKQLLAELKENPLELRFVPGFGWYGKEQADALDELHTMLPDLSFELTFRYQFLGRLQMDCEACMPEKCDEFTTIILMNQAKRFWSGNIHDQIRLMELLYRSFHDWEKPEWISMEDIQRYKTVMFGKQPFIAKIENNFRIIGQFKKEESYSIAKTETNELYAFLNLKADGAFERKFECKEFAPGLYGIGKELS